MEIEDRQNYLTGLFNSSSIKKTFGMELSYDGDGSAVFYMPYNPGFDHGLNQIHGGVYATLLDNAGWFTVAQHYPTWIATAEMQMRLLEPAEKVDLIAKGRILKRGKKIAMARMDIRTKDNVIVSSGSGTFVITGIEF
ncbi:PaaI family thioesterase [Spirochaetota bacterium]